MKTQSWRKFITYPIKGGKISEIIFESASVILNRFVSFPSNCFDYIAQASQAGICCEYKNVIADNN